MDANLMINIVAGLAVLDVTACLGYNLYMLKKYSDGPCGKYAIDFLPCSMLLKIAVILCMIGATFPPVSISGRIPANAPTAAVATKVLGSVGRIIIKAVAAPKAA